ncbi:MAG: MaoC family dehydratase N-terminal domain-containing protein [Novosphingobium sp.]|nr:MaoC family dehydratase N-terminal domain-containing protein [Novosphingobium sp.]
MLDTSFIGHEFPDRFVEVEAGQLRFFAKAIGETDPVYSDLAAAKAAGHPALPAPPTFLFSLEIMTSDEVSVLDLLGVNIGRVLHGEQGFTYSGQIYAGDRIRLSTRIVDIYAKKGGALEFVVQETTARNQHGADVGTGRTVTVVRNG